MNYFIKYLLPPIIVVLGLFGNTLGVIMIIRKKLKNVGPIMIYVCLFITDTIYLGIYFFLFFFYLTKYFINKYKFFVVV